MTGVAQIRVAKRVLRSAVLLTIGLLLTGCQRAPDGRKVFLRAEVALDKIRNFRLHLEGIGGRESTDAEFACDSGVGHWTTLDKPENQTVEYVQTPEGLFTRYLSPQSTPWQARRANENQHEPPPCIRLKHPGAGTDLENRRITVDQVSSLPPFFLYANTQGAPISFNGTEAVGGVMCEIWYLKGGWHVPEHTIWIGIEDHLPRKYVEGNRDHPDALITYFDYNQPITIEIPSTDSVH